MLRTSLSFSAAALALACAAPMAASASAPAVVVAAPVAAAAPVVVASEVVAAEAPAHAGAEGLAVGTNAPQFMLPVVNDFQPPKVATGPLASKSVKWGPAKWTGDKPDEAKKLVIMSFFATYCDPCKKEMPELARIYDVYKDQGLGVMLVSIDKGDEQRDEIVNLAKTSNVHFPVVHDRFQVVARRYAAERLPYMLMLDPAGNVKVVHVGYTEEIKANLENEVRGQLGLPPLEAKVEPAKEAPKAPKAPKGKG